MAAVVVHAGVRPRRGAEADPVVCQLGPLRWRLSEFCRGWLVTGATGSGKTQVLVRMLHELFRRVAPAAPDRPGWGGLAIDEKGTFAPVLVALAHHHRRSSDLVVLETRPEGAPADWAPAATFNPLLADPLPPTTLARLLVEAATGLTPGEPDQQFFRTQAESHIAQGIRLFAALERRACSAPSSSLPPFVPSLPLLHHVLTGTAAGWARFLRTHGLLEPADAGADAAGPWRYRFTGETAADLAAATLHFDERYWSVAGREQLAGVQGTIANYLGTFAQPDLAELVGGPGSISLSSLDRGAILCLRLPQRLARERRHLGRVLKLLFYQHALGRFDRPADLAQANLLLLLQDEAQRFIQEADGNVDVLREARVTTIVAAQSSTSLVAALGGAEKAAAVLLNLRNRVIARAADEPCAAQAADFLGHRIRRRTSRTIAARAAADGSRTTHEEEEHRITPAQLRQLPDFAACVVHASGQLRPLRLRPLGPDGRPPSWWADRQPWPHRWRRWVGLPSDCIPLQLGRRPS